MKKMTAILLALVLVFSLTACGGAKNKSKTAVYVFSGGNEYFDVVNGVIVLGEDEEVFSGGDLKINRNADFDGVDFFRSEFYILRDGEERTVFVSEMHDQTDGPSVNISGDLGVISGGTVITEGRKLEEFEPDLLNNLYFKLTVRKTDGTSNTYTVQMDVENV